MDKFSKRLRRLSGSRNKDSPVMTEELVIVQGLLVLLDIQFRESNQATLQPSNQDISVDI